MLELSLIYTLAIVLVVSPLFLHELGHYAALRYYKISVVQYWVGLGPSIAAVGSLRLGLFPIGAAVVPDPTNYRTLAPLKKMHVALAGPAVSLASSVVFMASWIAATEKDLYSPLLHCAALHFFLGVVNLLPIPPLDGFQAVTAWLAHTGHVLTERELAWSLKLGSGVVYGAGAYVVTHHFLSMLLVPIP